MDEASKSQLDADLQWVIERRLQNCYLQAGGQDEQDHPKLASIVKGLVGEPVWLHSPRAALTDVLRVALARLPEVFTGRRVDQVVGRNLWKDKPERQMAELLFGYRDNEVKARADGTGKQLPRTYDDDYLPAAAELIGRNGSDVTYRRALRVVRQDAASALLELEPEDVRILPTQTQGENADRSEADTSPPSRTPYIHRSAIEARFYDLLDEGVRSIWFVGPPAFGKTTIAAELTNSRRRSHETAIWLDAGSPERLERSLIDSLYSIGVSPPAGLPMLENVFRTEISRVAPRYVVIDDIADESTYHRVLPENETTIVVATSGNLPRDVSTHACIEVRALEPSESIDLIQSLLPDRTLDESNLLATTLGYHPMAIVTACGMIGLDRSISILGFCLGLRNDAATVFDGAPAEAIDSLAAIYRQTLFALDAIDPLAGQLLEMASMAGDETIQQELLVSGVAQIPEFVRLTRDQRVAVTARALDHLRRRYLLSENSRGWRMHPVMRAVLRGAVSDRRLALATALHDAILYLFRAQNRGDQSIFKKMQVAGEQYAELGRHFASIGSILRYESELSPSRLLFDDYFECMAIILSCLEIDTEKAVLLVTSLSPGLYGPVIMEYPGSLAPDILARSFDSGELRVLNGDEAGESIRYRGRREYRVDGKNISANCWWVLRRRDVEQFDNSWIEDWRKLPGTLTE